MYKEQSSIITRGGILYIIGTLWNESYTTWLSHVPDWYTSIFLTTRNGVFFGLPLLCVGEWCYKLHRYKQNYNKLSLKIEIICFIMSYGIFVIEKIFLLKKILPNQIGSMTFSLPLVSFFLLLLVSDLGFHYNTEKLRGMSIAIYLMQFGIIYVTNLSFRLIWESKCPGVFMWGILIAVACCFYNAVPAKVRMRLFGV